MVSPYFPVKRPWTALGSYRYPYPGTLFPKRFCANSESGSQMALLVAGAQQHAEHAVLRPCNHAMTECEPSASSQRTPESKGKRAAPVEHPTAQRPQKVARASSAVTSPEIPSNMPYPAARSHPTRYGVINARLMNPRVVQLREDGRKMIDEPYPVVRVQSRRASGSQRAAPYHAHHRRGCG